MPLAALLQALILTSTGCLPIHSYAEYSSAAPGPGGVVYLTGHTKVLQGANVIGLQPWVLECVELPGDVPRLKCREIEIEGAPAPSTSKAKTGPMFGAGAIDL